MNTSPGLTRVAQLIALERSFRNVSFCGKGAFKETFRACSGETLVAIKVIDRAKIDLDRTEREISALKRCSSPRIAKIIETFVFKADANTSYDVVVEEFLGGGSLEDRLKTRTLSTKEVIQLGSGLALAVKDLFPLQLVHRDIKPANIMFHENSDVPVLVDFGLVRDLNESSLTATWVPHGPGTPFYSSPEQLNNEKALIDWRSDQFSIGVLISLLLTGRHPYQDENSNPNAAIHSTLQRSGPAQVFQKQMEQLALPEIVKMVRPWPVQRYANPDQFVKSFEK